MANPTSNYGFVMPQNTDLVKDLPADFDIFGQAVDDRIKALNPETTAGDISYRGGTANAKTRLAIGTANQVLAVNAGATAPEWKTISAGGMTLLSTTTLSGTATAITGISQDYNELHIWLYGLTNATSNGVIFGFPKNSTTYLDTYGIRPEEFSGSFVANTNGWRKGGSNRWSSDTTGTIKDRTNANNFWHCVIPNYASTTTHKGYEVMGGYYTTDAVYVGWTNFGIVQSNSAVDAFEINNSGGDYTAGTVKIYGVK